MDERAATGGAGNFFARLLWTFQSPKRVYADIASGAVHWWQPWVWASLINTVTAYLSLPIQVQLARLNPRGIPQEELEKHLEMMETFGHLSIISTPVFVLVVTLIITGITYVVLSVLAESSKFRQYFTLYLYASLVSYVGALLGTIIALAKGVENIRSVEDASSSFGPALLLAPGQKILHAVLSTGLDVFQVWFYLLVGAGLVHVFKLGKGQAALVVLPVWLLFLLVSLVSARFAG